MLIRERNATVSFEKNLNHYNCSKKPKILIFNTFFDIDWLEKYRNKRIKNLNKRKLPFYECRIYGKSRSLNNYELANFWKRSGLIYLSNLIYKMPKYKANKLTNISLEYCTKTSNDFTHRWTLNKSLENTSNNK